MQQHVEDHAGLDRPVSPERELGFEALCRLALTLFRVPAAVVSAPDMPPCLVLSSSCMPEEWAFAVHSESILPGEGGEGPWVICLGPQDTAPSPRVSGPPHLRFCAGIAFGPRGEGRLRLFDTRPRTLDDDALVVMTELAGLATAQLALLRRIHAAQEAEADFRLLAETSTDTIVRGDLNGVRLYISPAVRTLLGYAPEELVGKRAQDITHPDDLDVLGGLLKQVRDGALDVGVIELRQSHKAGHWVWMEASIRLVRDRSSGVPCGYVASVRGIGARKEAEARLAHLASHDVLTGLPNRAVLGRKLEDAFACGQRFSCFCMDLDHFKQVNDTLGHQTGDVVLQEAAARFRAVLRAEDMVARLGGDEFAILQRVHDDRAGPEDVRAAATRIARRLIAALARPIPYKGKDISIGLSIGIACAPESGRAPDKLLSAADAALYAAKQGGRNTFRFAPAVP